MKIRPYQNPNEYHFQKVDIKRLEKKEFLQRERRYPRNFNYKNLTGITLYTTKTMDTQDLGCDKSIVLTHSYNKGIYFDGQDYGRKVARVWLYDENTRSQSIANLDFDFVEISRKDFDDYHPLILTRREIFSDNPVDNGFLGEWFARNVRDCVMLSLSVEEIKQLIEYMKDASGVDATGAKEVLERGWILRKGPYHLDGWRQ